VNKAFWLENFQENTLEIWTKKVRTSWRKNMKNKSWSCKKNRK
jgi:hypothetical protein